MRRNDVIIVSVLHFDPFSNTIASDTENLKFQGGQVHLNK